jgi:hypothetical protein
MVPAESQDRIKSPFAGPVSLIDAIVARLDSIEEED